MGLPRPAHGWRAGFPGRGSRHCRMAALHKRSHGYRYRGSLRLYGGAGVVVLHSLHPPIQHLHLGSGDRALRCATRSSATAGTGYCASPPSVSGGLSGWSGVATLAEIEFQTLHLCVDQRCAALVVRVEVGRFATQAPLWFWVQLSPPEPRSMRALRGDSLPALRIAAAGGATAT